MRFISVLILSCSVVSFACQKDASNTKNQNIKTTATVSATAAPSVSVPDNAKIKTYNGKGVVTKINMELGSVELNHEEIKGSMPAMIMEFYISDKKMLNGLKTGDKVDFVLEESSGGEKIIAIKKN